MATLKDLKVSYTIDKSQLQAQWDHTMSRMVDAGIPEEEAAEFLTAYTDVVLSCIDSIGVEFKSE